MTRSLRSFAIQRVSVPLAERRAESAKLLQDAGRADTRDILEAEEDLLEAKNSLTGALVDYELARLALWRDTEHLGVSEEGFSFQAIAPMSARSDDTPDTISGS